MIELKAPTIVTVAVITPLLILWPKKSCNTVAMASNKEKEESIPNKKMIANNNRFQNVAPSKVEMAVG